MTVHEKNTEKPIRCDCGKLIAKERDGKIYLFCKMCKKEVELKVVRERSENE